jgi:hypothetical protein
MLSIANQLTITRSPRGTALRTWALGLPLLLSVIFPKSSFSQSALPQLTLDTVNVKQEGVVTFSVLALGSESQSNFPAPRFLLGESDEQTFRLYVDVDSIQQLRFNAFNFTAYLQEVKGSAQKVYSYQITGNPTGSFRDAPVRVSFHVKTGGGETIGTILMPVYNAASANLLSVEDQREPLYVSVSGVTSTQLHLGNVPDALPVSITEVETSAGCAKCWSALSSAVNEKNPLTVNPGSSANLSLDLTPSSIPALLEGALVVKPDLPHDTLRVTLTYHSVPGGTDRIQTIPVKVRFGPGIWGLALALCGGIALGLTARYLLTGKLGKDNERALHAILSALVLGLIAEFIGVLMTAYGNSKLVLFDLDIDPRQLFPAFILAMLVSGGTAVGSWIRGMFGKSS